MRTRLILVGSALATLSYLAFRKALDIISSNQELFSIYGSVLHPSPQGIAALQNPGEVATGITAAVLLLLFACLTGAVGTTLIVAGLISRSSR